MVDAVKVRLGNVDAGVLTWDEARSVATFQYVPAFVQTGIQVSPLMMPLRSEPYRFVELRESETFLGLPGLVADSLTEKFGNQLLDVWLGKQGRTLASMTPIERLCYLGERGMGALEYEPDWDQSASVVTPVEVAELVDLARDVLTRAAQPKPLDRIGDLDNDLYTLIQVGTSAGGAKAKAIIAWNEDTNEVVSGQGRCPPGFTHWIIKFDAIENEEHATDQHLGRIEMAYHYMAVLAGIEMTPCRLMEDGERAHFMTQRFDRTPDGRKVHMQTFCGIAHQDRNPPGNTSYETLFATARQLGLGQPALEQLYLRMVFNILARNQDDHSKNHAFLMGTNGRWHLSPAYDICYSYKPGSRWIDSHQMRCNGKRDGFVLDDLTQAARAADVGAPRSAITAVRDALALWPRVAADVGLPERLAQFIEAQFRQLE